MADFFRDLKHSLRMFRQTPGFTIAAVAALTLGIGANTAIFSLVDSLVLRPLPVAEPQRMVILAGRRDGGNRHVCQHLDQRRELRRLGAPIQRLATAGQRRP